MADLLAVAAAEEAQGRRRQMLRTAFGPTIAAALADPTVIEVMVNPDGRLWIERATDGRVTPASASAAPKPNASSAWSPPTCAARCTTRRRSSRPSCRRPASASRA